mgnify:CR=1 FL=1
MSTRTGYRPLLPLGLLLAAAVGGYTGSAHAEIKSPCADDGNVSPKCTKEIRIWNNTNVTLYPVIQATHQDTVAINCPANKGGGDVWLQRALVDTSKCYPVKYDYYAYVNPTTGIPPGGFASVSLPWWTKQVPSAPDTYIDWWRAGRLFIMDDPAALNDSYGLLKKKPQVQFAKGSPLVQCNKSIAKIGNVPNSCKQLQIFQVTSKATIGTQTPYQLNEYTFASVDDVAQGGALQNLNQNYNVSNVDQVYLPVAIGPVRQPADVGYMGTTMPVAQFRQQLQAFVGNPQSLVWPVYNNPVVNGKPTYPKAGIRVPSTQTVFSFYMNPYYFANSGGKIPQIIPAKPPKLVMQLVDQWNNCTSKNPQNCAAADVYNSIDQVFLDSYKTYIQMCGSSAPDYLKPVKKNPPQPSDAAFLTYMYGWVPFNFKCNGVPVLPTTDQPPAGSRVPIDYMHIQYNYEDRPKSPAVWFNPYTQLIHGPVKAGGLAANAYAFSIDDHSSFLSNDGGSTPGGLIFAIGGAHGLLNKTQVPPPTPPFYKYFDFVVALAPPSNNGPTWAKYGICSNTADTLFPGSANGAYAFGIDPALVDMPCTVTLLDSANQKYQLKILKAAVPPKQIWPTFKAAGGVNFDPAVLSCPSGNGLVPPANWCNFTNELADPTQTPGIYSISTRGPVAKPKKPK